MVNFVVAGEGGHVDFGSEPKAWNQLVSVIVQDDVTDLMKSLLVLTSFMGSVMMQRTRGSLNSVAGCEIYADYHGHIHASLKVICEVIFDGLFEFFKENHSLFGTLLGESESVLAL